MPDSRDLKSLELPQARFPKTWAALHAGVEDQVSPAMVAGIWDAQDPDQVQIAALGHRRLLPTPLPVFADTIFDISSVSKVFATATLCSLLVERGWIRWDTPIRAILPGFSQDEVTIGHLLSHTSGLPAHVKLFESVEKIFAPRALYSIHIRERQSAMRKLCFDVPLEARPGERALYSDIGFLLLGFAIEELTTLPFDRAVRELLWNPMGVKDAYYQRVNQSPVDFKIESVAATWDCPWRKAVLQGQVEDENCWAMGGYSGHAGVFTHARELLYFASRLMGGFLSREVLRASWTRVGGFDRTLGWDTPSGETPSAGKKFSARSVGHLGFTGPSLWIDPDAELAVVLLTNRVHPSRENTKIRQFRPLFHEAIRDDLAR